MLSTILGLLLAVTYHPPVSHEVTLAGNFGEPRPHHFHGGIDIKTDGVEGKAVMAIGDGYVSRLTVGLYGFGNAVYVTHPEGYTSVYAHLQRFSPRLMRLFEWQGGQLERRGVKNEQTYDFYFSPLDCPVAQGQLIAISGNTGHSTAPHLHLEIHDTETFCQLDPLDFIGYCVQDSIPPQLHAVMACPQPGGIFNNSPNNTRLSTLDAPLTASGPVGFAIYANDYAETAYNHYGIRETILMVDGREVFHANVSELPTFGTRMVNAWGDYDHWRRAHTWFMKTYREPGVHLSAIHTDEQRGIVHFIEPRIYHLIYILRDFRGNESHYDFDVKGGAPDSLPAHRELARCLRYDRANLVSRPGIQLIVPAGSLPHDIPFPVSSSPSSSDIITFASESTPLIIPAELSVALPANTKNAHFRTTWGKDIPTHIESGWAVAEILDLGESYELIINN